MRFAHLSLRGLADDKADEVSGTGTRDIYRGIGLSFQGPVGAASPFRGSALVGVGHRSVKGTFKKKFDPRSRPRPAHPGEPAPPQRTRTGLEDRIVFPSLCRVCSNHSSSASALQRADALSTEVARDTREPALTVRPPAVRGRRPHSLTALRGTRPGRPGHSRKAAPAAEIWRERPPTATHLATAPAVARPQRRIPLAARRKTQPPGDPAALPCSARACAGAPSAGTPA